jgi:hypothetical protein
LYLYYLLQKNDLKQPAEKREHQNLPLHGTLPLTL